MSSFFEDNQADDDEPGHIGNKRGRSKSPDQQMKKKKNKATRNNEDSEATVLPCLACTEPRYMRWKWCLEHKACTEAMKVQANSVTPSEIQTYLKMMENDDTALEAVLDWCKVNPPSKKWARKKLINWCAYRSKYGIKQTRREQAQEIPMEEGQHKHWRKECGWGPRDIENEWQEFTQTKEVADYKGVKGSVRLWIEKEVSRLRIKDKYIDSYEEEGSDRLKGPKAEDVDCLRKFAHNSAPSQSHEFFSGKSSTATRGAGGFFAKRKSLGPADFDMNDNDDADEMDKKGKPGKDSGIMTYGGSRP